MRRLVAATAALASFALVGMAGAAGTPLEGSVGPGFAISLKDASGVAVSLDPRGEVVLSWQATQPPPPALLREARAHRHALAEHLRALTAEAAAPAAPAPAPRRRWNDRTARPAAARVAAAR